MTSSASLATNSNERVIPGMEMVKFDDVDIEEDIKTLDQFCAEKTLNKCAAEEEGYFRNLGTSTDIFQRRPKYRHIVDMKFPGFEKKKLTIASPVMSIGPFIKITPTGDLRTAMYDDQYAYDIADNATRSARFIATENEESQDFVRFIIHLTTTFVLYIANSDDFSRFANGFQPARWAGMTPVQAKAMKLNIMVNEAKNMCVTPIDKKYLTQKFNPADPASVPEFPDLSDVTGAHVTFKQKILSVFRDDKEKKDGQIPAHLNLKDPLTQHLSRYGLFLTTLPIYTASGKLINTDYLYYPILRPGYKFIIYFNADGLSQPETSTKMKNATFRFRLLFSHLRLVEMLVEIPRLIEKIRPYTGGHEYEGGVAKIDYKDITEGLRRKTLDSKMVVFDDELKRHHRRIQVEEKRRAQPLGVTMDKDVNVNKIRMETENTTELAKLLESTTNSITGSKRGYPGRKDCTNGESIVNYNGANIVLDGSIQKSLLLKILDREEQKRSGSQGNATLPVITRDEQHDGKDEMPRRQVASIEELDENGNPCNSRDESVTEKPVEKDSHPEPRKKRQRK